MATHSTTNLSSLLQTLVVEAGVAPGAAAGVSVQFEGGAWQTLLGFAGRLGAEEATLVRTETWFDLASLTKPVTAAAVAAAVMRGLVALDEPLSTYLIWTRGTAAGTATLRHLLSHRAGLSAHEPYFDPSGKLQWTQSSALQHASQARRPELPAGKVPPGGFPVVYSDLGYLLLGAALEQITAQSVATVLTNTAAEFGSCYATARQLRGQNLDWRRTVAHTEVSAYRGGTIQGAVHDDNTWSLAGLDALGHAGLFGQVDSVLRFGSGVLDRLHGAHGLPPQQVWSDLLRRPPSGSFRAGFDGKSDENSSAGPSFGPNSFGHLGFTGTSIWCDPDARIVCCLLTNRVCPSRNNLQIRTLRPVLHSRLHTLGMDLRTSQVPTLGQER